MIGNQRGASLIQLIVVIGLMSIVTMAVMSLMEIQRKETLALSEKLAANEIMRVVSSYLQNQSSCSLLFAASNLEDISAMPFDSSNVTTTNYAFKIKEIPGQAIVAGQKVSGNVGTLGLLPNSSATPGLQVLITSPNTATLQVNFDPAPLVRSVRSLSFPNIPILTTGPVTSKTITGCGSPIAGGMRWALLSLSPLSVVKGSGIDSIVSSGGPGGTNFRVTFSTPMPDANYTVLLTPRSAAGLSNGQWISEVSSGRNVNGFEFITMNWGMTYPVYGVPNFMNVIVIP